MALFAVNSGLSAPLIAASIAGVVGVVTLIANASTARRAARRKLYSDAYAAIMKRVAFVGRVRTRAPGADAELAARYWDISEQIGYYEGALWAESHRMGDACQRFSDAMRQVTELALVDAWRDPPVSVSRAACDAQPPFESYELVRVTYLLDARENSSPALWKRLGMERRFRERRREDEGELRSEWLDQPASASEQRTTEGFAQWMLESDPRLKPLSRRKALRNGAKAAVRRAIQETATRQDPDATAERHQDA
jgi:hypothetical protein